VSSGTDERTAEVTEHSVESGAKISDHVVINPETLSLELVVTQTPVTEVSGMGRSNLELNVRPSQFVPGGFLALSSGVRAAVSSLLTKEKQPVAVNTLQATGGDKDRIADAHDQLIRILSNALPVTVNFKGRIYSDYLLTRVTLTSNPGEFGMGRFTVDAQSIRTVTGEKVQLPDPADFRAQPKKSSGNKAPKEPSPDPTSLKSLAASGLDSLF
jgi:hypothetical protein